MPNDQSHPAGSPCPQCTPYFEHPGLFCLGRVQSPREVELAARFARDWEILGSRTEHPESGLYVECSDVRCRACGQEATCSDNAWSGGSFDRR